MRKAIIQPMPVYVTPAITIVIALPTGWVEATIPANVPESNNGKTGKIHAGVIPWMVNRVAGAANRCKYCRPELQKAIAMYIQNRTRIVCTNHSPVEGAPYICAHESKLATEHHQYGFVTIDKSYHLRLNTEVGKNKASCGCVSEHRMAERSITKRAVIRETAATYVTSARMKRIFPIVVRPSNR